jgi:hypothetical protein
MYTAQFCTYLSTQSTANPAPLSLAGRVHRRTCTMHMNMQAVWMLEPCELADNIGLTGTGRVQEIYIAKTGASNSLSPWYARRVLVKPHPTRAAAHRPHAPLCSLLIWQGQSAQAMHTSLLAGANLSLSAICAYNQSRAIYNQTIATVAGWPAQHVDSDSASLPAGCTQKQTPKATLCC